MSRMAEMVMEIEELITQGYKPTTIAAMLNVPLNWVESVEEDFMQLANPRFYGPDYDE